MKQIHTSHGTGSTALLLAAIMLLLATGIAMPSAQLRSVGAGGFTTTPMVASSYHALA